MCPDVETNLQHIYYKNKEVFFMVITPNIQTLKFKMSKGVKYFELFAEEVEQEILPGVFIKGWGYNGSIPGTTIQVCLVTL
jgi:hypothetical protein